MFIERIESKGLAHYSYVVGCENSRQAAVIDPKRDVDTYTQFAASRNLKITHVLETHIHADYASGAKELAEQTGAKLCLSAHDEGETYQVSFPHDGLTHGDTLEVGAVRLRVRHTPGHTPEHISFLIYSDQTEASGAGTSKQRPQSADVPVAMLSGDFLFVGSLGRPDLLGDEAKLGLANRLFDSTRALSDLPDSLAIYPAHGAGSMCGAGMSGQPSSTLGAERLQNPYLAPSLSRESFIQKILGSSPPFPPYYRRMKTLNSAGPASLSRRPPPAAIDASSFRKFLDAGHNVIDLRGELPFGDGHIPGALGIGRGSNLSTWAAWVVPYDVPILLVSADTSEPAIAANAPPSIDEAVRSLARVGLDDIRGYLSGGFDAWRAAAYPIETLPQISPADAFRELQNDGKLRLIDVRSAAEFASGHAAGATHIMGGEIANHLDELRQEKRPIAVTCGGGYRSTVAASVLQRAGFKNVMNVTGGMGAWNKAGLPTIKD